MYIGGRCTRRYIAKTNEMEKGNSIPICRRGHPGTSEYRYHRGVEPKPSRVERRTRKEKEREKVSKIQQEPDSNTDYSRG
jgi:hypothetical protein